MLVKDTRKGMGAGGAPAELAEERRPLRRLRFPSPFRVGRRMTFWLSSAISERFLLSSCRASGEKVSKQRVIRSATAGQPTVVVGVLQTRTAPTALLGSP
ncbi:hypothetical protein Q1695_010359 [Nippostrongylus brasiliensis]|nr:hypothetical protein Q1695_010359 [Nippostrongylus brasiliensis]